MSNLTTMYGRIQYLVESVEGIEDDPNRGRLLAILLYWKVFEGIDIPDDLMRQIMEKGSNPESINRITRMVLEDIRSPDPTAHRKEKNRQFRKKKSNS